MSEPTLIKGAQLKPDDRIERGETIFFVLPVNGIAYEVVAAENNSHSAWAYWWVHPSAELSKVIGCVPSRMLYLQREHLYRAVKPEPMTEMEALEYLQLQSVLLTWEPQRRAWRGVSNDDTWAVSAITLAELADLFQQRGAK